jgi:hypothetical protein
MADTGYNIPISASASASAALNSGGEFTAGDTFFDFGNGSQAGAPVYQNQTPTLTPTSTANSAAALGGPASTASGASAPGASSAASSGLNETTIIVLGLALAAAAAFVMLKKHGSI